MTIPEWTLRTGSAPTRFRLQTCERLALFAEGTDSRVGWTRLDIGEKPHLVLAIVRLAGDCETRERVSDLLWPDRDPETAQNNLRQALFRLRQVLGQDSIYLDRGNVRLDATDLVVDVEAVLGSSRFHSAGNWLTAERAESFGRVRLDIGWQYMGWCESIRRRLRDLIHIAGRSPTPSPPWGALNRGFGHVSSPAVIAGQLRDLWAQRQPNDLCAVELRTVPRATAAAAVQALQDDVGDSEVAVISLDAALAWPHAPLRIELSLLERCERLLLRRRGRTLDSTPLPIELGGVPATQDAWTLIDQALATLGHHAPLLCIVDGVDAWTTQQLQLLVSSAVRAATQGAMLVTIGGAVDAPQLPMSIVL